MILTHILRSIVDSPSYTICVYCLQEDQYRIKKLDGDNRLLIFTSLERSKRVYLGLTSSIAPACPFSIRWWCNDYTSTSSPSGGDSEGDRGSRVRSEEREGRVDTGGGDDKMREGMTSITGDLKARYGYEDDDDDDDDGDKDDKQWRVVNILLSDLFQPNEK